MKSIEEIQKIIQMEEGKPVSVDETLDRVLKFYGKFVPYGKNN